MNGFDLSTISGLYVGSTPYSAIYKGSVKIWEANPDYSLEYFTIESLEDNNTISIIGALGSGQPASSSYDTVAVWYYSIDKVNWTEFNVRNSTQLYNPNFITLNKNQKVYLKTTSQFYKTGITNTSGNSTYQYNYFDATKNFKVYGNIMSLCYGDNFVNQTGLPWTYTFYSLFKNCTKLIDASNLVLPATTLAGYCYSNMFYSCSSLTTAPSILPATTLTTDCYRSMFDRCSSLTTAPELPATTLAQNCYRSMFYNCSSLITAPELPATRLMSYCYQYMFYGCTLINYIKALFTTDISSTTVYTNNWLYKVAATGIFVKSKDATWSKTGASGIPSGWTVQDDTHDYSLDYFTIVSEANNNTVSIVAENSAPSITVSASTDNGQTWTEYTGGTIATLNTGDKVLLKGVNNTFGSSEGRNRIDGTQNFHAEGNIMSLLFGDNFVGQTSLSGRDYALKGLFVSSSKITSAENLILPATTLSVGCYNDMFCDAVNLTIAPALPATTLTKSCYSGMFARINYLTTAPVLPASTLAQKCYANMFLDDGALNYVKCLATNISASNCTQGWLGRVSSTGTFVKAANMSSWPRNGNGIPSGWTVTTI